MNVLHQNEVSDEQSQCDDRLRAQSRFDENDRREEVADGDALQHAGNPNRREMKVRKTGEKLAQQKNDNRAIKNLEKEGLEFVAALDPFAETEWNRHPNDKQKERKDQIGRRPAVPFRVL